MTILEGYSVFPPEGPKRRQSWRRDDRRDDKMALELLLGKVGQAGHEVLVSEGKTRGTVVLHHELESVRSAVAHGTGGWLVSVGSDADAWGTWSEKEPRDHRIDVCDDLLRTCIQDAHRHHDVERGLRQVTRVWEASDNLAALAESRASLLLRRIAAPNEATIPAWAQEQLGALRGSAEQLESVVSRAEKIMAAAAAVIGGRQAEASIEGESGPGKIVVVWHGLSAYLRWVLEPCSLPWPGVRASVYTNDSRDPATVQKQRVYDARALLKGLEDRLL